VDYQYQDKTYHFKRYPKTANRSLQAWNAADELMLSHVHQLPEVPKSPLLLNDRFGFLSCMLHEARPVTVIEYKSQEKACINNFERNHLKVNVNQFIDPLAPLPAATELALIQIPKSLDLFYFYLEKLSPALSDDGTVICAFMTRHFNVELIKIASLFFDDVEQSKAWKKARLLILKKKKTAPKIKELITVPFDEDKVLKQYPGVFSAEHVDYASRLLLQQLHLKPDEIRILDMACGNGVLAQAIQKQKPEAKLYLMDDAFLAIESAKLNIEGTRAHYHYTDTLDGVDDAFFDLIVSNPPFHFAYETNIEVAVSLFAQARRCLRPAGRLLIVANRHLNYKTHLQKMFRQVSISAQNDKYEVIECSV